VENAGFKNVGDFWIDPGDNQMPEPPPPPPDPAIQLKQMELQADAQKFQAQSIQTKEIEMMKHEAKMKETEAELQLQASNDQRDAQRETLMAQHRAEIEAAKLELDKYKVDADNRTKLLIAQIQHPTEDGVNDVDEQGNVVEKTTSAQMMAQAVAMLAEQMNRPKVVLRDEAGRVVGVQ
jgi:hypothetical protein